MRSSARIACHRRQSAFWVRMVNTFFNLVTTDFRYRVQPASNPAIGLASRTLRSYRAVRLWRFSWLASSFASAALRCWAKVRLPAGTRFVLHTGTITAKVTVSTSIPRRANLRGFCWWLSACGPLLRLSKNQLNYIHTNRTEKRCKAL